jgi:hypothetical protein
MLVATVQPRCVDTSDEVEFDTALFEPTNHHSDDEGYFCNSTQQCSFFFCRHLIGGIMLISSTRILCVLFYFAYWIISYPFKLTSCGSKHKLLCLLSAECTLTAHI